jgi:predicted transposase YdaD
MHTDTIFYQIFLTFHTLLFELLGQPTENAEGYQFTSVEVKEKALGASQLCSKYKCLETSERIKGKIAKK